MKCNTLMVQGTSSDAGKSALVTGLCRYYYRLGWRVAPFKPQNMALNSAVTVDGGEIGRAQAVQASACGLEAHTDMNPVLLKPNTDRTSQVIIHGKAVKNLQAQQFRDYRPQAMQAVLASYQRLQQQYQYLIVEGAGSPAEINLRQGDIANMGFAETVDCPVILVADIDRGGVFAHIIGTLALLSEPEKARVIGFVINRFRGDKALLQPGLDWIEQETGKPVLGVLPFIPDLYLESEDSLSNSQGGGGRSGLQVVVPRLPRLSNHTDFDALEKHSEVNLQFPLHPRDVTAADLLILPGSKSVCSDMQWLKAQGWPEYIDRHLRYGGKLMGICGGMQMLGHCIEDPDGIEGFPDSCSGLGLLELRTVLKKKKTLINVSGRLLFDEAEFSGYEIHAGVSNGPALQYPLLRIAERSDGAISEDQSVIGTYVHGLFDTPAACQSLLHWAGLKTVDTVDISQLRQQGIERMANAIDEHLDMRLLHNACDDWMALNGRAWNSRGF